MATTYDDPGIGRHLEIFLEKASRHTTMDEQPLARITPFEFSFSISATQNGTINNTVRLLKMPPGAYIFDLRATPSDMDTNVAPAIVYDLLFLDASGTTKLTAVSGSTNAQAAAGSDRIANAAVGKFVGGYYLAVKFTTAPATAAAGTLKVVLLLSLGVVDKSGDVVLTDTGI